MFCTKQVEPDVPCSTCFSRRLCEKAVPILYKYVCVCIYGHHFQQSMDQLGIFANPTRGQLNWTGKKWAFPCPCSRLRILSRGIGSAVLSRISLLILYTQAESGAYSRDPYRFPRRRPHIPPTVILPVPSLSGHAIVDKTPSPQEAWRVLRRCHEEHSVACKGDTRGRR